MTSLQLISVNPPEVLVFAPDTHTATLTIRNLISATVSYAVKTRHPEMYIVSPSYRGDLPTHESVQISIKQNEEGKDARQFQIVATTAEGLSSSVRLKVGVEDSASQFVTSVLADEPMEDVEKTKANMRELQAQSLQTTKDLDHMRMEIQKLEHQLRFRGESKLQTLDNSGYTVVHLLLGFLVGLVLAAITR
jgi:hypothetical protein